MEPDTLDSLSLGQLARLLEIDGPADLADGADGATNSGSAATPAATPAAKLPAKSTANAGWSVEDSAEALRHLLDAPLLPEIAEVPGAPIHHLRATLREGETFRDALTAAALDPLVLEAIKHFARNVRSRADGPLTAEGATVLYYAAVGASQQIPDVRISTLTPEQIRIGCEWARHRAGAESLSGLFENVLRQLAGRA